MQHSYLVKPKTSQTLIASHALFVLCFGLLLGSTVHAADTVTVSSGLDYSTGDYGQVRNTNILVVPFSVRYKTDAWSYKVATVYQYIEEGSGGFLIGGNIVPNNRGLTNVSGLGDFIVSTRYTFDTITNLDTEFDLTGRVKLATADETKGLGTGSNDYTVELGVYQPLINNVDMFSSLGYRIKGDLPQTKLNNVWLGSVGFSFPWDEDTKFGLIYDFRQSAITGGPAISEINPYWDWKIDKNRSMNTYGVFGLSNGSPNFGAGMQVSYSY